MIRIALKHWIILVLAAIIAGGSAFTYFNYMVEPKFSAMGSIIVTNGAVLTLEEVDPINKTDKLENADITASQSFAETAVDILKTHEIYVSLAEIISDNVDNNSEKGIVNFSKKYSYSTLQDMASIKRRNEDTLFIDITFTASNGNEAVNLVNTYLTLVPDYIEGIADNIQVKPISADKSNLVQVSIATITVLAAIAGVTLVYGIIFLIYSSDTIIRNEESFKERFDLPIIGVIPDFTNAKSKESKYYKYNGYSRRYGYNRYYGYGGNNNADK